MGWVGREVSPSFRLLRCVSRIGKKKQKRQYCGGILTLLLPNTDSFALEY